MAVTSSWPWFGFEDPTPDLSTGAQATVAVIDAFGMDLAFDAGGAPARFTWTGADLAQVFTVGDVVTATFDPNVQSYVVTGAKGQAVAMRYGKANVPATLPAIPGGGPALALETACVLEEQKTCLMPEHRTLYTLHATLAGADKAIPSGQTAFISNWQIRHVKTLLSDFYTVGDCVHDTFFDGMVHALEIKP